MSQVRRPGWSGWWQRAADGAYLPDPDGPAPIRIDPNGGRSQHRHGSKVQLADGDLCPAGKHPVSQVASNGRRRWCRACNRDRAAESAATRKKSA